jgi:uncharacterized protein with HEPN domain
MQRRPDVYVELALIALRKVPRFLAQRSRSAYLADDMCQSAVERQLEIAGAALAQLKKAAPTVFGRVSQGELIVAFRNLLAHGYATLDHSKVYEAATFHTLELTQSLESLLNEFPDTDD